MAHQEQDREDLLAEANALTERISFRIEGQTEETVVGFRRDHSASFYFGPNRVYQFTSAGELRRAYLDPLMFKAERGQLVSLRRMRRERVVEMLRHEYSPDDTEQFLGEMRSHLEGLHQALSKRRFAIVGQVPETVDLVGRVSCWLDEFSGRSAIAQSPRVQ